MNEINAILLGTNMYDDGYNQALEDCCNVLRQCWLNGTVANRIVEEQITEIEKLKR